MTTDKTPAEAPEKRYVLTVRGQKMNYRTRPWTLSWMALENTKGIDGPEHLSVKRLREVLGQLGVKDPEASAWEVTLPNGVVVGSVEDDGSVTSPPSPGTRAVKRASKRAASRRSVRPSGDSLAALKAEKADVDAWEAGGEQGEKPPTPLHDLREQEEAKRLATLEARKAEAAPAKKAPAKKAAAAKKAAPAAKPDAQVTRVERANGASREIRHDQFGNEIDSEGRIVSHA